MPSQYRVVRTCFLLLLAVAAFIGGCEKSVQSPPAVQEEVKLSPEQKIALLTKKAEAGDARAQHDLGLMYVIGEDIRPDPAKASEWWLKAAEQGHVSSQQTLGAMYKSGEGVTKDNAKAMEWLLKAASQGNAAAQVALGEMYKDGEGAPKDPAKAVEWWQKAVAQGNAEGQRALGWAYSQGYGITKDVAKAIELYQKAAAQGNSDVMWRLGKIYSDGQSVPKDFSKAVEWFQKSAGMGNPIGQAELSRHYAEGKGVPRDLVLAYAWINVAVSQHDFLNDELFGSPREKLESALNSTQISEAQRLSSSWKKGLILIRESSAASAMSSGNAGNLSKRLTGTFFVVSKMGHAITNQHVVDGCIELRVPDRGGVAKLVAEDVFNDLALVQLQGAVTDTAIIAAEPGKLRQGENIVVFGFPLSSVLSPGGNLTPGVVSALTGLGNNTNQIQITAPIQPGSSGSSVLNKKGEVVGVVSMKLSDSKMAKATGSVGQNVNFAVSGQMLRTFLDTHKVTYNSSGFFSREKSTVDLADEARKWTLVVECWR